MSCVASHAQVGMQLMKSYPDIEIRRPTDLFSWSEWMGRLGPVWEAWLFPSGHDGDLPIDLVGPQVACEAPS